MSNPLIEAAFAAARKHLALARVAQKNALVFGLDVYRGGKRGQNARFLRKNWDRKRRFALEEVARVRHQIRGLRRMIAEVEASANQRTAFAAE